MNPANSQDAPRAPPTIAGEPLHDLGRAIGLLKSSKFYSEGFLMRRQEVTPDGKAIHPNSPEGKWAKWFVQLSGTIMSTWNAAEMEEAARQNCTVPPQYLNLADAFLHPYPPNGRGPPPPTEFQFALNSAGLNRLLFCAPTLQALTMWINAIRLAGWERSRCNEIYTGSLLGLREPKLTGWSGYESGIAGGKGKLEGWLKVRLPGDTEWRRVWTVVTKGQTSSASTPEATKKSRRTSLLSSFGRIHSTEVPLVEGVPGDGTLSTMAFYELKPTKKDQPMCIAQHIFYCAAIFPESEQLVEVSTLFKVEGTFLNPADGYRSGWGVGGRAEKQGFALLMLDEGNAMAMLQWIVGMMDAFKLYGRPKGFSFDPRDPSSLYFALPVGPHRDRQFLDRELVDHLDINESRPRAIRATFHNILFDRMRGVRSVGGQPLPSPGAPLSSPGARTSSQGPPPPQQQQQQQAQEVKAEAPNNYLSQPSYQQPPPQNKFRPSTYDRGDHAMLSLPSIGETPSPHHSTQPSLENTSGLAHNGERTLTPDHLAASGPSTAIALSHQPSRSDTGDVLENYGALMNSDLAQEPEPVQQPFKTSASPYMASSLVLSGTVSLPNFSRPNPINSNVNGPPSPTSEMTHLTYAAPSTIYDAHQILPAARAPSPVYAPRQQQRFDIPEESERADSVITRLTSPGADNQQRRLDASGSQPHPRPRSRSSCLVPSTTSARNSAHGGSTYLQEIPTYLSETHNAPEELRAPLREVGSDRALSPFSSQKDEPTALSTEADVGRRSMSPTVTNRDIGRVITEELHNGGVTESPESVKLFTPSDTQFTTKPLFSPSPSLRPTEPEPVSEVVNPSSLVIETGRNIQPPHVIEDIHSDLLAALSFVDRTESPPPPDPSSPSTTNHSPVVAKASPFVGPPSKAGVFTAPVRPSSPIDEEYVSAPTTGAPNSASPRGTTTYPSSFAINRRAEERAANAQLAQAAQQAAKNRPGRSDVTGPQKKGLWEDSDEEEEPEEEEEDDTDDVVAPEDTRGGRPYGASPPPPPPHDLPQPAHQRHISQPTFKGQAYDAHQSYYENGPERRGSPAPTPSPPRGGSPAPARPVGKPALSPHGLLHAGIIEKEERSARAQEFQARDTGGPLVSLPSKPPPPQTGLVGAITSREREKERTGGVGRALTEQQRERMLAEQRQKQLDDLQRHQLQQQQQQFGGGSGFMNPMMQNPMMQNPMMQNPMMQNPMMQMNPWMMGYPMGMGSPQMGGSQFGGMGGPQYGGPQGNSPAPASPMVDPAQMQAMWAAQQAAQFAAQQAYMSAMQQFQQIPTTPPHGSPHLNPSTSISYPGMPSFMSMSPSFYPSPYGGSQFGGGQMPGAMLGATPHGGAFNLQMPADGTANRAGEQDHSDAEHDDPGSRPSGGQRSTSPLSLAHGRGPQ